MGRITTVVDQKLTDSPMGSISDLTTCHGQASSTGRRCKNTCGEWRQEPYLKMEKLFYCHLHLGQAQSAHDLPTISNSKYLSRKTEHKERNILMKSRDVLDKSKEASEGSTRCLNDPYAYHDTGHAEGSHQMIPMPRGPVVKEEATDLTPLSIKSERHAIVQSSRHSDVAFRSAEQGTFENTRAAASLALDDWLNDPSADKFRFLSRMVGSSAKRFEVRQAVPYLPLGFAPPRTLKKICDVLSRGISDKDRPGYIYIYFMNGSDDAPNPKTAHGLLNIDYSDIECLIRQYAFDRDGRRVIRLKIGYSGDVPERMKQWKKCRYSGALLRVYPFVPGLEMHKQGSHGQVMVPNCHRVESLIHAELADERFLVDCSSCRKRHKECFEIDATIGALRSMDEVAQRWIRWAWDTSLQDLFWHERLARTFGPLQ
ncbi:DUF1766-domain-containing protein [Myriangium duriaei CBS 260.36]|uniref:DUF1766-domain-containing protein n=1 Tax=Myriangium duriaei CBS 260.36 TaxID=1168546 RepID=A0A9P4IX11_9PEZI|nr:DUF1766-domain-containing protein [Myriangium duriaei CBS 260.36]